MKRLWNFLTFYDKFLIIILLAGSVFFIISPLARLFTGAAGEGGVVVIKGSNGFYQRLPLTDTFGEKPVLVRVPGPIGTSLIEARNGRVRMKEAPPADPEKICEKTGWIDQAGPMIICVPNRVSVWIEAKETDLDGVSW